MTTPGATRTRMNRDRGRNEPKRSDSCSPIGLTLLDQLTRILIESRDVLGFLHTEVDLTLDELDSALELALIHTVGAFQAASLLQQQAALDVSWSTQPSRPRAVQARHSAAVASGALRVEPAECWLAVEDPTTHMKPPEIDPSLVGPPAGTRSACGHPTTKNRPCIRRVVMLDATSEASGCQTHIYGQEAEVHDTWQRKSREASDARTKWFAEVQELRSGSRNQRQIDTVDLWIHRQANEMKIDLEAYLSALGVDLTSESSDPD